MAERARKREWMKKWRRKNPEKVREIQKRWRQKHRDRAKEQNSKYQRRMGMGREHLIFNYILENKDVFDYEKVYLCPTKDFDFLGIRKDGSVERVEIERNPQEFFRHNHNAKKCDRVISLFNTTLNLPVTLTVLDKDKFASFVKRFNQQIGRLIHG